MPRKKSPVTPPGIDPGTFRLVAQWLNHYATPGPYYKVHLQINRISSSVANFFFVARQPLIIGASRSHTTMHHTLWDSSGREISATQSPVPDNTQYSQETDIRSSGGTRSRNPSKQEAADRRFRPRGQICQNICC
jgi:hypothetical protein